MTNLSEATIAAVVRRTLAECLQSPEADLSDSSEDGMPGPAELFRSPATLALKEEIVKAGKKLWHRQYVDGNGGNISVRLSPHYVLCTPTLCSKGDLRVEDLALVNLDNERICGDKIQTSEIRLHLQIYKTVPEAKAVIHCHPPYATAHAVAGVVPQGNLLPEQEVFVGPLALTPYETPGTWEFARTILPVVRQHNSILLANHGIVCWADTVTHAEWYVEVAETYCKTIMIASQLRPSLPEIPPNKIAELLEIKKKLGLPDARFPIVEEPALRSATDAQPLASHAVPGREVLDLSDSAREKLVARLTAEISALIHDNA